MTPKELLDVVREHCLNTKPYVPDGWIDVEWLAGSCAMAPLQSEVIAAAFVGDRYVENRLTFNATRGLTAEEIKDKIVAFAKHWHEFAWSPQQGQAVSLGG